MPVCFAAGGPAEFITSGANGFLFTTVGELVARTLELLAQGEGSWVDHLRREASGFSVRYDEAHFATSVRALLEQSVLQAKDRPARSGAADR